MEYESEETETARGSAPLGFALGLPRGTLRPSARLGTRSINLIMSSYCQKKWFLGGGARSEERRVGKEC